MCSSTIYGRLDANDTGRAVGVWGVRRRMSEENKIHHNHITETRIKNAWSPIDSATDLVIC